MDECDHNCENCTKRQTCNIVQPNEFSNIKKIIAVGSGKGGVGKSVVTSLLAIRLQRQRI